MNFQEFLLNENRAYLGQRVGDILTALQNLHEDGDNLSMRAMERGLQKIVARIRKILHGRWDDTDRNYLKTLQKVGVAIMRGLDKTDVDMTEVVASCVQELESLTNHLQEPLNALGSERSAVDTDNEDVVDSANDGDMPGELESE